MSQRSRRSAEPAIPDQRIAVADAPIALRECPDCRSPIGLMAVSDVLCPRDARGKR